MLIKVNILLRYFDRTDFEMLKIPVSPMLFSATSTQGLGLKYDKRISTSHRDVRFLPSIYPTNSAELTEDREADISMSIICIVNLKQMNVMSQPEKCTRSILLLKKSQGYKKITLKINCSIEYLFLLYQIPSVMRIQRVMW